MTGDGQGGEVEDDLVEHGDDPGRLVEKVDGVWNFQIIVCEPLGGKGPGWRQREVGGIEGKRKREVYSRGWVRRN